MESRKYTDKDGNNRTAFEMIAEHAYFGSNKENAENGSAEQAGAVSSAVSSTEPSNSSSENGFDAFDDDAFYPFA